VRLLLKGSDIDCKSNPVHICSPGANLFCWPSELLSTTTTTCFSKLSAYIIWCLSCGQNLIRFATHCCPTASAVCATFAFAEPHNSLPKNAHDHYHDLRTKFYFLLFGLLHGWVASLGHIFKIHLPPDHFHKLALSETCTFVHGVHRPSPLQLL
jgi:hypothetical protein